VTQGQSVGDMARTLGVARSTMYVALSSGHGA
jgi:hypothetical protein